MAADILSSRGLSVTVAEAKPSLGRKFLMAGKSGLNITMDAPLATHLTAYGPNAEWLSETLTAFGPTEVKHWAKTLGQDIFTGSTGRVFPRAMKASPLLRAWIARLTENGVTFKTRWRWTHGQNPFIFETPEGAQSLSPDAAILATGGASWARLGSDGAWADTLGLPITPFAPANAGLRVAWSDHMTAHFGQPIKSIALTAGSLTSRGEIILTPQGIEGGGIYSLTPALRKGTPLRIDLLPDMSVAEIATRLARPRGKQSRANHLRKSVRLSPVKRALLSEITRPLPEGDTLAKLLKALPVPYDGIAPMDQAISVAGGLPATALTPDLELIAHPGLFAAGEMLDWEAPTGGYLITACLATGMRAAMGVLSRLGQTPA